MYNHFMQEDAKVRKIKLESVLEFGSRADFAIIDITENPAKKRGTITIDYAPSDIRQLQDQGLDFEGAMAYYKDRIYSLVKYYISGDWEDAGGYDDAMKLIERHIRPHYE